jgi:hypothetical protein
MASSWLAPVDIYCERTNASFWAEPLNAATNAAFLVAAAAAALHWARAGGRDWPAAFLIALAAIVGTGSFLFHTFANRWSLLADVLPIAAFIYSYFLIAMRRFLGLSAIVAAALTGGFVLFNMTFPRLWLAAFPEVTLNGSVGYLPAAGAMALVGAACRLKAGSGQGALARAGGTLIAAALVFAASLTFRSLDHAFCGALPVGTHFLWHLLNALVLFMLMRAAIDFTREGKAHAG